MGHRLSRDPNRNYFEIWSILIFSSSSFWSPTWKQLRFLTRDPRDDLKRRWSFYQSPNTMLKIFLACQLHSCSIDQSREAENDSRTPVGLKNDGKKFEVRLQILLPPLLSFNSRNRTEYSWLVEALTFPVLRGNNLIEEKNRFLRCQRFHSVRLPPSPNSLTFFNPSFSPHFVLMY